MLYRIQSSLALSKYCNPRKSHSHSHRLHITLFPWYCYRRPVQHWQTQVCFLAIVDYKIFLGMKAFSIFLSHWGRDRSLKQLFYIKQAGTELCQTQIGSVRFQIKKKKLRDEWKFCWQKSFGQQELKLDLLSLADTTTCATWDDCSFTKSNNNEHSGRIYCKNVVKFPWIKILLLNSVKGRLAGG